ncbi:hypothetical protein CLOSBL3_20157 [Clostridiaceae bacterium BL-3]|nr:hypothetical protein CLOSBL3_20157 [Clostridiaceae bacterium BL-3]
MFYQIESLQKPLSLPNSIRNDIITLCISEFLYGKRESVRNNIW